MTNPYERRIHLNKGKRIAVLERRVADLEEMVCKHEATESELKAAIDRISFQLVFSRDAHQNSIAAKTK